MLDEAYASQRLSAWDNTRMSIDHTQFTQEPLAVPRPSVPYNLPAQKINSTPYITEIPSSTYPPRPMPSVSQLPSVKTSSANSSSATITPAQVAGLLAGLVLAGIPLGVIVTMYVQASSSSSSGSSSGSSSSGSGNGSVSYSLPAQCSSTVYTLLNDATRLVTATSCCPCDSGISGWYRITGSSGSRLVTTPVSSGFCSTGYPTWFNGTLPTTVGSTTNGIGCTNYNGNPCYSPYSASLILATNCNGFYVFYLQPLSCGCCSNIYPRYCTT